MKRITITATFVWVGFVCAISFMEAWLKFQAPNITTKLGLGIGQLVFGALNKVELTLALTIWGALLYDKLKNKTFNFSYAFTTTTLILLLQTFWLLPELSERAVKIMNDIVVPQSNLHFLFVLFEIVKVVCLTIFGLQSFKSQTTY